MWHHVTNHLIISNDKDSNSENRIKLRVRDSLRSMVYEQFIKNISHQTCNRYFNCICLVTFVHPPSEKCRYLLIPWHSEEIWKPHVQTEIQRDRITVAKKSPMSLHQKTMAFLFFETQDNRHKPKTWKLFHVLFSLPLLQLKILFFNAFKRKSGI
jgi:hypothetical protein